VAKTVFLSHASKDARRARYLCRYLEEQGIDCWIAPRDVASGKEYGAEIIKGIEDASALVLVLSEMANQSSHVQREIERAVNKGKPVFPVRVQEVQPSGALEYFIASSQWIDAFKPPLERNLPRLVEALRLATGGDSVPQPVLRKGIRLNFMLYGSVVGIIALITGILAEKMVYENVIEYLFTDGFETEWPSIVVFLAVYETVAYLLLKTRIDYENTFPLIILGVIWSGFLLGVLGAMLSLGTEYELTGAMIAAMVCGVLFAPLLLRAIPSFLEA
jgi:TIR domain